MSAINDLTVLLKSMKPEQVRGKFVFCTLSQEKYNNLKLKPVMIFQENEGVTLILGKSAADKNSLQYTGTWAFITLTVHSDLAAVGFLAAITKELAKAGISVNAVSAYYHDHLFVPYERVNETLKILRKFSR